MEVRLKSVRSLLLMDSRQSSSRRHVDVPDFRPTLRRIGGKLLTVDTRKLFADSFVLKGVPGIVCAGFAVPAEAVDAVIADVRPTAAKCNHCNWCYLRVKDQFVGQKCPKCNEGQIERLGPLKP
jgi:hypothetical protein